MDIKNVFQKNFIILYIVIELKIILIFINIQILFKMTYIIYLYAFY